MKKQNSYLKLCNNPYKDLQRKMNRNIAIIAGVITLITLIIVIVVLCIHFK